MGFETLGPHMTLSHTLTVMITMFFFFWGGGGAGIWGGGGGQLLPIKYPKIVTVHGKTYFSAYPLDGRDREPFVNYPLENSLVNVRGVHLTVSSRSQNVRGESVSISPLAVSVSRYAPVNSSSAHPPPSGLTPGH